MNVRYVKSATVVIEHKGKKVLCDPWLTDGIYYGSWFAYPAPTHTAKDFQDIDYIYISHVHPDHCDVETLKDLPKVPVIILDFHEKFLKRTLEKLGFTNIIEVPHNGEYPLGPDFNIHLLSGDNNDHRRFSIIYGCNEQSGKTRQIDSLAIFSGGGKVVINSNDVPFNLIAGAFDDIKAKYKTIDMLLVSYAGAGPYPQAYTLPHQKMIENAVGAAYSFLSGTLNYIVNLNPKFFMPYAGEYVLGGPFAWMNRFKGTLELDELPMDLLPSLQQTGSKSMMILLNRGESFDVDNSQASKGYTGIDFVDRHRYIDRVLSQKKLHYQTQPSQKRDLMPEILEARKTLYKKQQEYSYYKDIQLYIDVGFDYMYQVDFSNDQVTKYDRSKGIPDNHGYIHAQIDFTLLEWILDRKANWNNAEVGSHIILSEYYNNGNKCRSYEPMPHFLMSYFQRPLESLRGEPLKQMVPEAVVV